ncbi:9014_t:CDS:2 [Paraglomus brasilianum]|uniref:9014_t:CDS:1 n=1 Tax=Paraglomus brasilianum TaxID=144538 RepID=A0A9N9ATC2_9GLOM|nr:9014_t:CDS:2 [Paraglomus brasilianum]
MLTTLEYNASSLKQDAVAAGNPTGYPTERLLLSCRIKIVNGVGLEDIQLFPFKVSSTKWRFYVKGASEILASGKGQSLESTAERDAIIPNLQTTDIGFSMGIAGTEVAKEVSPIPTDC